VLEPSAELMAEAVERRFHEGETEYWLPPLVLADPRGPVGRIRSGDAVIFCCRRGEREIQLTQALTSRSFREFSRRMLDPLFFVPLTLYHPALRHLRPAFAPQDVPNTLGEVISRHGFAQLRVGEEEKYAHVTYFLSGGRAEPFPKEVDRRVPSFLKDPLRSLPMLTEALATEIASGRPQFAAVNVASGDILGHAASLEPKMECAEAVDRTLAQILDTVERAGYWTVITADHGLLEDAGTSGGPPNSSHTTNPVPFLVVGPGGERPLVAQEGALADVAPTILDLLRVEKPADMTGRSLLRSANGRADRVLLVILDGWGLPSGANVNPIALAKTPLWDELSSGPRGALEASGEAVGLLPGRKGNSEAGHLNIGAGRVVAQDEVRIEDAMRKGVFTEAPPFLQAVDETRRRTGALQLIGLLSESSSHGSVEYVLQLLKLAHRENVPAYVHLITDGRSTVPGTAPELLRRVGQEMARTGSGQVVTLIGRGFALDRGGDYAGKTQVAYKALVEGDGRQVLARP